MLGYEISAHQDTLDIKKSLEVSSCWIFSWGISSQQHRCRFRPSSALWRHVEWQLCIRVTGKYICPITSIQVLCIFYFLVVAHFCLLDLYYCNIGPAWQQHQHTDCIYGHHTELLVRIVAVCSCQFYTDVCFTSQIIDAENQTKSTGRHLQAHSTILVNSVGISKPITYSFLHITLHSAKYPIWLCDIQYLCNVKQPHITKSTDLNSQHT